MYGIIYRINGLHGFAGTYALFCWNFPWSFYINVAEFHWYNVQFFPSRYGWSWTYRYKLWTSKNSKKKKSNSVKSHDLGSQFWLSKQEITLLENDSCNNWIIFGICMTCCTILKLYVIHIHILQFRHKKTGLSCRDERALLTIIAWLAAFSKKNNPMVPPAQNPRHNSDMFWMHLFLYNYNYSWIF